MRIENLEKARKIIDRLEVIERFAEDINRSKARFAIVAASRKGVEKKPIAIDDTLREALGKGLSLMAEQLKKGT